MTKKVKKAPPRDLYYGLTENEKLWLKAHLEVSDLKLRTYIRQLIRRDYAAHQS